jgi:hypothetical protein
MCSEGQTFNAPRIYKGVPVPHDVNLRLLRFGDLGTPQPTMWTTAIQRTA